jgi:hypothetical protein
MKRFPVAAARVSNGERFASRSRHWSLTQIGMD